MSSPTTQRLILMALKDSKTHLTYLDIAAVVGIGLRSASNMCSLMAGAGILSEHPAAGGDRKKRYGANVDVLPVDAKRIAALVDAYGRKAVLGLVKAAEVTT